MHGDRVLKIYRSQPGPALPTSPHDLPGSVSVQDKKRLLVATGDGTIALLEVQQEGRKRMDAEEFLRGYSLHTGDKFL